MSTTVLSAQYADGGRDICKAWNQFQAVLCSQTELVMAQKNSPTVSLPKHADPKCKNTARNRTRSSASGASRSALLAVIGLCALECRNRHARVKWRYIGCIGLFDQPTEAKTCSSQDLPLLPPSMSSTTTTLKNQAVALGLSVPPFTAHAISVSLPTWKDNVGYEEGEKRVVDVMVSGYPRFFIHLSIQKVRALSFRPLDITYGARSLLGSANKNSVSTVKGVSCVPLRK